MASSKLEYLKRYMEGSEETKKKRKVRKVKSVNKNSNVKIFDTNVDLKDVKAGSDSDDPAEEAIREDAPEVAEIIDERPLEMRAFKKTFQDTRKSRGSDSEDERAPRRRARHDSSDENSPPRKPSSIVRHDSSDESPPRKKRAARHDSSDESPPRKSKTAQRGFRDAGSPRQSKSRRRDSSDESPPRRGGQKSRRRDSDESPPRRGKSGGTSARKGSDMDSPPRRPRRQDRGDREIVACEVLQGPEAITLRRSKNEEEVAAKREQAEKEARRKAIYDKWSAGLVQQQQKQSQIEDIVHEANKPLARAANDRDLEDRLKAMDREGDPMLAFLKKKRAAQDEPGRPRYNGPQPPPNRYNIWPGYRWDGVDRSNGFEAKMMAMKNDKMANEEQAYKWSIEDM